MTDTPNSPVDFSPNDDASSLAPREMHELRTAFKVLDVTDCGKLDIQDMLDVLDDLVKEDSRLSKSTNKNLERLYGVCAKLPPTHSVTEDEFVQLIVEARNKDTRTSVQRVFDRFSDHKSYIDLDDLSRMADALGEDMTKQELQEMMEFASANGKVTIDDFSRVINRKLSTTTA